MNVDQFCTASFSGYRPNKFAFPMLDENNIKYLRLQANIQKAIMKALELGYKFFLCGMAHGFDLLCADILLDIREQDKRYHNISLTAVLPYADHTFIGAWGEMHRIVKQSANQVVIIAPRYAQGCYHWRNQYLMVIALVEVAPGVQLAYMAPSCFDLFAASIINSIFLQYHVIL